MADLGALRVAKQALDEGLIQPQDYDMVKVAFLKAQQIKAGLDAGFIRQPDYEKAREAYLHALDFSVMAAFPAASGGGGVDQQQGAPMAAPRASSMPMQLPGYHHQPPPAAHHHGGSDPGAAPPAAAAAAQGLPPRDTSTNGLCATHPSLAPAAVVAAAAAAGASGFSSASGSAANTPRATSLATELPADLPQYAKGMDFTKVSMSGIRVREECVNMFMHMKTRSAFKWIIFRVDDAGKFVIVEQYAGRVSSYNDFVAALPEQSCRYAVYDYQLTLGDRGSFNKLVFVNWAPAETPVRQKMMFASTKDFFKRFLDGIGAELQATERDELLEEEMKERVLSYIGAKAQ